MTEEIPTVHLWLPHVHMHTQTSHTQDSKRESSSWVVISPTHNCSVTERFVFKVASLENHWLQCEKLVGRRKALKPTIIYQVRIDRRI